MKSLLKSWKLQSLKFEDNNLIRMHLLLDFMIGKHFLYSLKYILWPFIWYFISVHKRSCGKREGNIFTGVCQSFCSHGGVAASACNGAGMSNPAPLLRVHPPAGSTIPTQGRHVHPPDRYTPQRRSLQRTVRILLECFLVWYGFWSCTFILNFR